MNLKIPERYFNITGMLKDSLIRDLSLKFPSYHNLFKLDIKTTCASGGRLDEIYQNIENKINELIVRGMHLPDVVIIYQDSDIDDLANLQKKKLPIEKRLDELRFWLSKILMYLRTFRQISHLIVIGPTFFGTKGEIPSQWPKDKIISDVIRINKVFCSQFNATHLDSRTIFQLKIQEELAAGRNAIDLKAFKGKQWPKDKIVNISYGGILTFDGNHANYLGSMLLVNSTSELLLSFGDLWIKPEVQSFHIWRQFFIIHSSTIFSSLYLSLIILLGLVCDCYMRIDKKEPTSPKRKKKVPSEKSLNSATV